MSPTDAASPSWTQSMATTAIEAPERAGERPVERFMRTSEGHWNRSRPRDL